ncbi:MAG: spore coat U domain-containing protein [Pseudomonadota bacterium]
MSPLSRSSIKLAVLLGVLVVSPHSTQAGSASTALGVSASVATICNIQTASQAFPAAYDPIVANAASNLDDATGSVTVACTKGTSPTIDLDLGQNASGTTRRMANGVGDFLSYEVFQDAGWTTVWGSGAGSNLAAGVAPSKAPRSFTTYARIPAAQDVPTGAYSDALTATVNF